MTNFEELKQKAKDTMETIADRSVELYKIAEEKTKVFAKLTKLSTEIALEKSTARKLYKELGKKYYELHKSAPEEALAQACAEVTSSLESIAAKQREIDEIKSAMDIDDFDDVEPETDDIEVEIIIEDLNKPEQTGTARTPEDLDENTAEAETDAEDIIGKTPPEFKL